ncbi:MlaD family protein [Bradymonas sediminis]|uniref:Uncharacterized protein n=1 Tax=Bradymonas sediminis TaxID=1548548 RepID=A0A2Z4FJJ6_9DELT|nr:MlaD family protein [Bradymonas sediminis]AWV89113.1 hypothetical protein DN745_07100 [Bradymonas sediminis]TDP64421.1 phospholipid/cholesterol/gamma-HCH transport system substrate-binding protein [Bradymonas sediminis]
MQKKETSIEVKVGALVLFSLTLLVGFVLILGDFSFSDGFTLHVDFDNAGGLKPGAEVAIAGISVGNVQELKFQPTEKKEDPSKPAVGVRATLRIDKEYADSLRVDNNFFISTRGVLGEPYIEIETVSLDTALLEEGAVVQGTQPPRLDVIVRKASGLLDTVQDLLTDPSMPTKDLLGNAASLMGHLDELIVDNRENIDETVNNTRMTTEEAAKLLAALNFAVDDGKGVQQMLRDAQTTASRARSISTKVDGKIAPLLDDATVTAENARVISDSAKRLLADNEQKIQDSVDNVHASTENIEAASGSANSIIARIEEGEGTVGRVLADREMYDDVKEILRTIKRQPWKILWKE